MRNYDEIVPSLHVIKSHAVGGRPLIRRFAVVVRQFYTVGDL